MINLMMLTADPYFASLSEKAGVDIIFYDLELNGKEERQKNYDTLISHNTFEGIKYVKKVLNRCKLLVRINSLYEKSIDEINTAIESGADIIMVPMIKNSDECNHILKLINGRCQFIPLLETKEAIENLESISKIKGIDTFYIGLNDLHLSMHYKFMFEPLENGLLTFCANVFKKNNKNFGFGGLARFGKGIIDAKLILSEHYFFKSNFVILSREFRFDNNQPIDFDTLKQSISCIRNEEEKLVIAKDHELKETHFKTCELIRKFK